MILKNKLKWKRSKIRKRKYIDRLLIKLFRENSAFCSYYSSKFLKFVNISFYKFIKLKLCIFFSTFLLLILIKYTDTAIITDKILNEFDYRVDLIYEFHEVYDAKAAMDQEIRNFLSVKNKISKKELMQSFETAMIKINLIIEESGEEPLIPVKIMASKIYNRLVDYYNVRRMNLSIYLFYSFIFSLSPELLLSIYSLFIRSDAKRELKFLKKLMILNGNIKPVDFNEVLKILISKSKYYTKILKDIDEKNRSNSFDNLNIYIPVIRESKNIEEKLFFEKLDEANNYDFDQAIKNIENEFSLEKREVVRNIRKRIEHIHIVGLLGLMTIILILTLYLIIPWMSMYNLNQFSY